jgi:hypothetical protein
MTTTELRSMVRWLQAWQRPRASMVAGALRLLLDNGAVEGRAGPGSVTIAVDPRYGFAADVLRANLAMLADAAAVVLGQDREVELTVVLGRLGPADPQVLFFTAS